MSNGYIIIAKGVAKMLRVRELREARGIQQKELAIDLGVSQPTISDWESGRKVPSAKSTLKLADYFGVSVDYLLGRDGEDEAKNEKKPTPVSEDGQSEKDQRLVNWFRSLPEEKQKAILISQDAPEELF